MFEDLHVLPDDSYAAAVEAFQRASCNLTDPFVGPIRMSRGPYSSPKRGPATPSNSSSAVRLRLQWTGERDTRLEALQCRQ
jgi:hypothetical protein